MNAESKVSNHEATSLYLPTANRGVTRHKHRLDSDIWLIVVPTALACVAGSIFFRSYFVSVGDPSGGSISAGVTGLLALPMVLLARFAMRTCRSIDPFSKSSAFVADGHERALQGIEAEIRPMVEQKYADEWSTSGVIKRWFLLRRMEREIAQLLADRSAPISPDSVF